MSIMNSGQEASSSTSRFSYDVFLSSNSQDTRTVFTSCIYNSLDDGGFLAGDGLLSALKKAIQGENAIRAIRGEKAIPGEKAILRSGIYDSGFVSSTWCFAELVMILKQRTYGHGVLPIYYDVDPSEVTRQDGSFEEAFPRHEQKLKSVTGERKEELKNKMRAWRAQLGDFSGLTGIDLKNQANGYDSRLSKLIVIVIGRKVSRRIDAGHAGIESALADIGAGFQTGQVPIPNYRAVGGSNGNEDDGQSCYLTKLGKLGASRPEKKRTREIPNWEGIACDVITFEHLQQHFGSKREDAAKCLGVSVSTFKRVCRHRGIYRWPNRTAKGVLRPPDQHGEMNPSPTLNTLSTNGQITRENEMSRQNSELNECLLVPKFDDPNFQNIQNIGNCPIAELGRFNSETVAAGGSAFQLEGQTTQSTTYPNHTDLVFPQSQIALTEVVNENMGSSEDGIDWLASQGEAYFEGHVSESSNLKFPACSYATSPSQPVATILHTMSHLTGRSSECAFQQKNQSILTTYPDGNGLVDPHPQVTSTQIISENMGSLEDRRNFLVPQEEPLPEGHVFGPVNWTVNPSQPMPTIPHTSVFQLEGQTTQSITYPNHTDLVFPQSQIALTEVVNEDMGSLEDGIDLLASQAEAHFEGHVSESSNLKFPACSYATSPSQPVATILHAMSHLTGGSSECAFQQKNQLILTTYPNGNDLVDPHPQIASTQILSENMGSLEDWRNFLVPQEEPLPEGHVFGLVDPHAQIASTVPLRYDPARSLPMPTNTDTIPTIPQETPTLKERQDSSAVKLKATYGDDTIKFQLSLTAGITDLKGVVSKRLELGHDSFKVKYMDEDGEWILITSDEEVRDLLQLNSLGNQFSKLMVLDKVSNNS